MKKIVVFASGSGTNFQAIIDATDKGEIQARIAGLIASREEIGAVTRALHNSIPYRVIPPSDYPVESHFARALMKPLNVWQPDLIVLAGYMFKIPDTLIHAYPSGIVNIHPSLLPKYGGKGYFGTRVHRAVLEAGEPETGCTVHLVNERYDEGPVLAQKKVKVLPEDTPETLAKRVQEEEHKLFPRVIQQLLTQKTDRTLGTSTS